MTKKELEDELKVANDCIIALHKQCKILEEQSVDATKLLVQIADLEHDLKEEKFCYQLAASRAKHFKSQIAIIKETLSLKETQ